MMFGFIEITPIPNKCKRNNCQLTHDGHNNLHGLFTVIRHIFYQTRKGIMVIGNYGRHIQGGSQFAVSHLGYSRPAFDARAALVLFRI